MLESTKIVHRVIKKFSERLPIPARENNWEGSLLCSGSAMCPLWIGEKQTLSVHS